MLLMKTAVSAALLGLASITNLASASIRGVEVHEKVHRERKLMDDKSKKDKDSKEKEEDAPFTILDAIGKFDSVDTLAAALVVGSFEGILSNTNYAATFFAPLDSAFAALPEGVLEILLTPEYGLHLFDILAYHTSVSGAFFSYNLTDDLVLDTLQREGEKLYVDVTEKNTIRLITQAKKDNVATVPASNIIFPDLEADNGVTHKIDFPLLPKFFFSNSLETLKRFPDKFSILLELIELADLVEFMEGFMGTVLAPTNEAFAALGESELEKLRDPDNILLLVFTLQYHLFPEVFNIEYIPEQCMIATVLGPNVEYDPNRLTENDLIREVVKNPKFNDIELETYYLWSSGIIYELPTVLTVPTVWDTLVRDDTKYATLVKAGLSATPRINDILDNRDLKITLFAPVDEAFAELPDGVLDTLLLPQYGRHLFDILAYHVHLGNVFFAEEFKNGQELSTAQKKSETIEIKIVNGTEIFVFSTEARKLESKVPGVKVINADMKAINGIIHDIDGVLLPQFVYYDVAEALSAEDGQYSILLDLLAVAEIDLTDFSGTVFAPTNEAFEALGLEALAALKADPVALSAILSYHISGAVVNVLVEEPGFEIYTTYGSPVVYTSTTPTFNDVISADYHLFGGGIIYSLESVLALPNVATVISIIDNFEIFEQSLDQSGLLKALANPDETFTVFAPDNDAFSSLPKSLFDDLLKPEFGLHLFDLLAYHIAVGAALMSEDLVTGLEIATLQRDGEVLTVNVTEVFELVEVDEDDKKNKEPELVLVERIIFLITEQGQIDTVTPTLITLPDLRATNGVVHGVDRVLLPRFIYLNATGTLNRFSDKYSILLDLLEIAGLTDAVSVLKGTLLAPNNEALSKTCVVVPEVEEGTRRLKSKKDDKKDKEECLEVSDLITLLSYHVIPLFVFNFEIGEEGQQLTSLLGNTVTVSYKTTARVAFNAVDSFQYDLFVGGVIYELSGILVPAV